jgi:hypothetical protein
MANYDARVARAPRDREILILVATGDEEEPIAIEIAWWEESLKRWEGDYRYDPTPGNYSKAEPLGWAPLPPPDQSFLDLLTRPPVRRAPKRPSKAAIAAAGKAAGKGKAKPPEPKPPEPPNVVPLRPKTPEDAALAATMPKKTPA